MKVDPQQRAALLEGDWLTPKRKAFKDAVNASVKLQSGHLRIAPGTWLLGVSLSHLAQ